MSSKLKTRTSVELEIKVEGYHETACEASADHPAMPEHVEAEELTVLTNDEPLLYGGKRPDVDWLLDCDEFRDQIEQALWDAKHLRG